MRKNFSLISGRDSKLRSLNLTHVLVILSTPKLKLHSNPIGPLLDEGAPYYGMGMHEFRLIQKHVDPSWNDELDPLPDPIKIGLSGSMDSLLIQVVVDRYLDPSCLM